MSTFTDTAYDPSRPAPTYDTSCFNFYDIESLHNIFTVTIYSTRNDTVMVFYLLDEDDRLNAPLIKKNEEAIKETIRQNNPALFAQPGNNTRISLHNLSDDNQLQWLMFHLGGISVADKPHIYSPRQGEIEKAILTSHHVEPSCQMLCDTHPKYDFSEHPFIVGYNSQNYDLTMLSVFLATRLSDLFTDVSDNKVKSDDYSCTAARMRAHNDNLFDSSHKRNMTAYVNPIGSDQKDIFNLTDEQQLRTNAGVIYRNWLNSGRHVDMARLNELQSRVGLKRLLGQMGHQILESDRLEGHNARVRSVRDVADLFAYNASDVIGTHLLMADGTYSGSFDLRSGLLHTYPETVFEAVDGTYDTPNIDRRHVQKYRRIINSSSAQFAASILAPYRKLQDIPGHNADLARVSYRYPAPEVAKAKGIKRVNVLTQLRDFIHDNIHEPQALARCEEVYNFYRDIEGQNFNTSAPVLVDIIRTIGDTLAEHDDNLCDQLYEYFPEQNGQHATYGKSFTLKELEAFILTCETITTPDKGFYKSLRDLLATYTALYDSEIPFDPPPGWNEDDIELSFPADKPQLISGGVGAIAERNLNLPYVDANGQPTSCFATFSTGGIHGAEYNVNAFNGDNEHYIMATRRFRTIIDTALDQYEEAYKQRGEGTCDDKTIKILNEVDEWVDDPRSVKHPRLTENSDTIITDYTPKQQAIAAMWIRANIRITIINPDSGEEETIKHDKAVMATAPSKRHTPYLRLQPKGLRAHAQLFKPKQKKAEPEYPVGVKHDGNRLNADYTYTSVADVIHEDFTSYYPLLLTNMAAFSNPDLAAADGKTRDRYQEIFHQKEDYGKKMKDPDLSDQERNIYKVLRQGTKLVLNAASGAADASNPTKILMNNRIITMRVIGQLFSWRIGQAQSLAGARIISTNTDGLYSTLDEETNNRILAEQAAVIGVDIEPEPLTLVSKDANNRIEYFPPRDNAQPWERDICAVGGSDLACATGPTPTKSIDHPVITDYVLAEYFKYIIGNCVPEENGFVAEQEYEHTPVSMEQPLNTSIVTHILDQLHEQSTPAQELKFYQTIISASPGSNNYPYSVPYSTYTTDEGEVAVIKATDTSRIGSPNQVSAGIRAVKPTPLQHYSRGFIIDPDKARQAGIPEQTFITIASARASVVNDKVKAKRLKNNDKPHNINPAAEYVLNDNGVDRDDADITGKDIVINKYKGIDPDTPLVIYNHTLENSAREYELDMLVKSLDRNAYIAMINNTYENNWRNAS